MECTLCYSVEVNVFESVKNKNYFKCNNCDLVFLDPLHYLEFSMEKFRYDMHQNSLEDKGYVDFLNCVIEPTLEFIIDGDEGLDYGCGPNPVLAKLLDNLGYTCLYYDPIFFPRLEEREYDFIFATECFEHFYSPAKDLKKINKMLKSGGILAIMTELNDDSKDFRNWYYINDPTHVCFYSQKTISYICREFEMEVLYSDNHRVVVFRKM